MLQSVGSREMARIKFPVGSIVSVIGYRSHGVATVVEIVLHPKNVRRLSRPLAGYDKYDVRDLRAARLGQKTS